MDISIIIAYILLVVCVGSILIITFISILFMLTSKNRPPMSAEDGVRYLTISRILEDIKNLGKK